MKHKKRHIKKFITRRRQQRIQKLKDSGRCQLRRRCTNEVEPGTDCCIYCWCKTIERHHKKRQHILEVNLVDIRKEQDGKCQVTGIKLIPGKTASLDHIIPICRGGKSDRQNLRFVHKIFNNLKGSMLDEEAIEELKVILPLLNWWVESRETAKV